MLFGAYHYGGMTSPFLFLLVPIPIAVLMHFGPRVLPRVLVLGALALQLLAFCLIPWLGPGYPTHVPSTALTGIGVFAAQYGERRSLFGGIKWEIPFFNRSGSIH